MMRTIVALARSSHPEPVVAVTALSGSLALTAGRGLGTLWVVLAVLAGQLFVGWANDYLDRSRDPAAAPPDKPLATHALTPRTVGVAALAAPAAAAPLSLPSGLPATIAPLVAPPS